MSVPVCPTNNQVCARGVFSGHRAALAAAPGVTPQVSQVTPGAAAAHTQTLFPGSLSGARAVVDRRQCPGTAGTGHTSETPQVTGTVAQVHPAAVRIRLVESTSAPAAWGAPLPTQGRWAPVVAHTLHDSKKSRQVYMPRLTHSQKDRTKLTTNAPQLTSSSGGPEEWPQCLRAARSRTSPCTAVRLRRPLRGGTGERGACATCARVGGLRNGA